MATRWTPQKVIRDPVHGYISLDPLETSVVDSPYLQRLRGIKQNSTAYLTYPSALTTRFEHSLGVMEVAGRVLRAVLQHSGDVAFEFLSACRKQLNPPPPTELMGGSDPDDLADILFRVVRLTGLCHDLGHVPFSHAIERTLSSDDILPLVLTDGDFRGYSEKSHRLKLHEYFTCEILKKNGDESTALLFPIDDTAQWFRAQVTEVLEAVPESGTIYGTLHEIISSTVDADRGDFLLRDGTVSGAGFGTYDIDRLIRSLRLAEMDGRFVIRPGLAGLSAVETFLLEHRKLYKYLYYHHHCVLTDTSLGWLIGWMLLPPEDAVAALDRDSEKGSSLLRAFALLGPRDFHYGRFLCTGDRVGAYLDDAYIMERMRDLYQILYDTRDWWSDHPQSLGFHKAYSLLQILLHRKPYRISIWKYDDEYRQLDSRVENAMLGAMKQKRGDGTPGRGRLQLTNEDVRKNVKEWNYRNKWGTLFLDYVFERFLVDGRDQLLRWRIEEEYPGFGFLLAKTLIPRVDYDYQVLDKGGRFVFLRSVSTFLPEEMETVWHGIRRIHAYLVLYDADLLPDGEIEERLIEAKRRLNRDLARYFKEWYVEHVPDVHEQPD